MDSPASAADPPRVVLLDRARVALICAGAGSLFSFLGAIGSPTLSSPAEKFVVVCTVALLGGAAGWLSRFKT
jgi:hypothetical protein